MTVSEAIPPRSESYSLGNKPKETSFRQHMADVRNMITIAIGTMKELSATAVIKYKAPGMRIVIGEILSCLGHASKAASIDVNAFNFKEL